MIRCDCATSHSRRRIALTGGPGAGKTALLEMVRQTFCAHVRILPEAAGIVFGGGFPRESDVGCQRAAQRAIYHVQRELESAGEAHDAAIVLCDRGTVDGWAYWPPAGEDFFAAVGTTAQRELARYDAVLHLRTPAAVDGYNHDNPLRTESAEAAARIDARIATAWKMHPRRFVVDASPTFVVKVERALEWLRNEVPACCRERRQPASIAN
jgi:predicted ATPase